MTEQQKAAMQQALDFILATNGRSKFWRVPGSYLNKTVTALRAALDEPEPEPVAWADKISFENAMKNGKGHDVWPKAGDYETRTGRALIGIYTAPPTRRPLTDDQRGGLVLEHLGPAALTGGKMSVYDAFLAGLSAAERAHGIGGNDE